MRYCGFAQAADLQSIELASRVNVLSSIPLGDLSYLEGWRDHWSRGWEFPFVYTAINEWLTGAKRIGQQVQALEAGCGVTPMPFWLSSRGLKVTGVDVDPACTAAFSENTQVPCRPSPKYAHFQIGDMERLNFSDGQFDIVYSISAIEHAVYPDRCIREMCRVCRPGGLIAVTFDVCLKGRHGLSLRQFKNVTSALQGGSDPFYPILYGSAENSISWRNYCQSNLSPFKRAFRRVVEVVGGFERTDFAIFAFIGVRRGGIQNKRHKVGS